MPQRFNKMIELLGRGQPVYNVLAKDVSYEGGKAMAQTWADYIKVDMEHAPFDIRALDQFMRGLVDGGPTKSGHRIPAVVAEVPAEGVSAEEIRANAWMFKQVSGAGRDRDQSLPRRIASSDQSLCRGLSLPLSHHWRR